MRGRPLALLHPVLEFFGSFSGRFASLARLFSSPPPLIYPEDSGVYPKEGVIIIPPRDYWALLASLNVKSEKEAAAYAPALFDLGEGYRYEARKTDTNLFVLIAYDPQAFSERYPFLFEGSAAGRITFAQWVFAELTSPVRLKNGKYLGVHDGIVIEMEGRYVDTSSAIGMEEALRQSAKRYRTIRPETLVPRKLTQKTALTALAILWIFIGNLVADIVLTHRTADELTQTSETLLRDHHLSVTSIEREAVLNALKQKEEKQRQLRTQCLALKNIPFKAARTPAAAESAPVPAASSSAEGVVLIPGSKPGEPNRLLVGGVPDAASPSGLAEGIREVSFDGKSTKILIETRDGENLKKNLAKHFRQARIEYRNNELEVRLK